MTDRRWLVLDASLGAGSIALIADATSADGARVLEGVTLDDRDALVPELFAMLRRHAIGVSALGGVVVGGGPGSFTALRIVGAVAKGLAEGAGVPLFAVPTLALLAASTEATRGAGRWLATLDALRGEQYAAEVTTDPSGAVRDVSPLGLVARDAIPALARERGLLWIGPDAPVTAVPAAAGAVRCLELIRASGPEDAATWQPRYGRLAEAQVQWEAAHGRPLAP